MAKVTKKQNTQKEVNRTYLTENSSKYINRTSLEYSTYTLERALVGIDGLKSAQRKAIYAITKTQGKIKTLSLAGKMIEMEIYVHGDSSASGTLSQLASPVANNYTLIEGEGSFGTCASPEPAAPRYTYVRKSQITEKLLLPDLNIVPMKDNYDGSTQEPRYFLPIIPVALLGTDGISVGYKPSILPRKIEDIIDNTIAAIEKTEMKFMTPYYRSYGSNDYVEYLGESKYIVYGKAEVLDASTVRITGLPHKIDREKIIEKLIKMQDNNEIRDYDDSSTDNIDITVKMPRGVAANWKEMDVLNFFSLNSKVTEAIICLSENEKVRTYSDPNDLIRDYVEFRFGYYIKRFEKLLQDASNELRYKLLIKECFDNEIPSKLKNMKNRAELVEAISGLNTVIQASKSNIDNIVSFPSYRWTEEYYVAVQNDINELVASIGKYEDMLQNNEKIWDVYLHELKELRKVKFD